MEGAPSRQYFIDVAAWLGYEITINEFAPFMAGISQVGDTREPPPDDPVEKQNFRWYIGPAEQRFVWQISVGQVALYWFRAGSGQAGVIIISNSRIPDDMHVPARALEASAHRDRA